MTTGPSPIIVPADVVHLYLIGLPLGETASAVKRTCGVPELLHALTVVASEVRFSLSGALVVLTTVALDFCASAGTELTKAASAIGAANRESRARFLNICTPCGKSSR